MMNSNMITTSHGQTLVVDEQKSPANNHHHCNPCHHHHHHHYHPHHSTTNIVNNTFHSNFNTNAAATSTLLPFNFAPPPPPGRFFSMLHHQHVGGGSSPMVEESHNAEEHVVVVSPTNSTSQTTVVLPPSHHQNCGNCSSTSMQSCPNNNNNISQQSTITATGGSNVFVPNNNNQQSNLSSSLPSSDSIITSKSNSTTRTIRSSSLSDKKNNLTTTTTQQQPQQESVNKNQELLLDAPASVLLLEPPSLSTIIDDHHPTIPTSAYYLKKQQEFGPNNDPSLPLTATTTATTPRKRTSLKQKKIQVEAAAEEEISVENCDENVCLVCGCEEDKIEAELRLQDKLERTSHKRPIEEDEFDENDDNDYEQQMNVSDDDNSPSSHLDSSPKKRKMLTQLENLEALESVLHQLEPDCVLYIFQFLTFSGKDYWFSDIRNMYGRFKYNNQILPLFKFVTIEQESPLTLDEDHHGSINCNIQCLTIERRTNQPLECENGYLKKVGGSLKTFIYYNRTSLSKNNYINDNTISLRANNNQQQQQFNGNNNNNTYNNGTGSNNKVNHHHHSTSDAMVMGYLSSEDEKDLSSFELIEDENSHVIGLKRRARSEGSCLLKEVYRNCRVLEKLKIVDIKGYVPFKVSMRPGTNRPVDCLAFTNTLTKIRLFNCMLPNHSLQAISKMSNLKSLHFEKIFVSDSNQYDALLKLRNLEVLKIQVAELPATVLRNLSTSFPKLTKLFINVLSNGTFDGNLKVDQLRELRSLSLVSHFKVDLLSLMRNCTKLLHLQLGFDVCFNHIFPNERLTSCILRNVFVSPDRSKVLIQNNTLVSLKLSGASIRAAQKELAFIKQQRQLFGKPLLSITEFSQQ